MKKILLLLLLLFAEFAYSQPGRAVWLNHYGTDRSCLRDVYVCEDGGYVAAGGSGVNRQYWEVGFVVRTDANGQRAWQVYHDLFDDRQTECFSTVIEADGGDIVAGGSAGSQFIGARLTSEGDLIWARIYGGEVSGWCTSVIETKNGGLLFGGSMAGDQAVVMTNNDGDVIWSQTYDGGANNEQIMSLREVDGDGYYFAGWYGDDFTTLTKITGPGDPVWRRVYREQIRTIGCGFLLTVANRFYLAGSANGQNGREYALILLDRDGNEVWRRFHPSPYLGAVLGACRTLENGVNFVGQYDDRGAWGADCFGVNHSGDSLSYQRYNANLFWSVVTDKDGFSVACGDFMRPAYLCKMNPFESTPVIVSKIPPESELTLLRGDTVNFSVRALDYQGDPIHYCWTLNQDTVSSRSTANIIFRQLGLDTIKCVVSDRDVGDSTAWFVEVTDLFIYSNTPDSLSLTLKRGALACFSLDSVRVAPGDPVQYQWTLTNIDNFEREDAGTEPRATLEFLQSGNFQLEGLAYRANASDNVVWTIQVRSAILDFWPRELSLLVNADSLINFGVLPFNSASDSLSYRWELDGDSVGCESTVGLRFAWRGQAEDLSYQVSAIVMDGGEGDTVNWQVTVLDPNATPPTPPSIEGGEVPAPFGITSVSPNPFNNSTTIRFVVPSSSSSSLTLHDLTGREVQQLVNAPLVAGEHSFTLNGDGLPAGVYLVRLEANGVQAVRKIVLMR